MEMRFIAPRVFARLLFWVVMVHTLGAQTNSPAVSDGPDAPFLVQAHAHNDYEHPRPLLDALAQGFCSVEADVWLVDGKLLVAHDQQNARPARTLSALYLDPLRDRIRRNAGRVYPTGPTCMLLIDVKSEAAPTYTVLRDLLQGYEEMLTVFTRSNTQPKAITVILSGNRAPAMLAAESVRLAALDGRLPDLDSTASPALIPLISDNWRTHFAWRGEGPIPEAEQVKLRELVSRAHERGRRIRFWGAPDLPAGWRALGQGGVDLIGTDNLAGLSSFLRSP